MARPIDANWLKENLGKVFHQECDHLYGMMQLIDEAPTLTPPNEWVSVEDAVPDPGVRVLAANGNFVGEAYMASNGAWMRHDGFPWKVDCWMPMPDRRPPEGDCEIKDCAETCEECGFCDNTLASPSEGEEDT